MLFALLNLFGLSDEEKQLIHAEQTPQGYFEALVRTGFPKLYATSDIDARELYLSSYTQTYIERDVPELLRIDKPRGFEIFLRLCALRTGCIVNFDDLARDAGVSAPTVKSWLSVLEDSFLEVSHLRSTSPQRVGNSDKLQRGEIYGV